LLPDRSFGEPEKAAFLASLDFLILALPLTAKSDGLLGEAELHALPRGAVVLNPARGPLIQGAALLAMRRDGHPGGAALDTHYQYPLPPEYPRWAFPHVILTPHISGTSFSPHDVPGMPRIFRENARRFPAGETLLNAIPPADLQSLSRSFARYEPQRHREHRGVGKAIGLDWQEFPCVLCVSVVFPLRSPEYAAMKITRVRTILSTAPQQDLYMKARARRSAAFIVIETDTELTGLGETYAGYFIPEAIPSIVEFYAPILVGQSPLDVVVLSRRMVTTGRILAHVGLGSIVLSWIESALLDLKGKRLGVPVYELLGGRCHETLPCYATGATTPHDRAELEGKVAQYLKVGFTAVKLGAGTYRPGHPIVASRTPGEARDVEVSKVEFLRQRFADSFVLHLDAHMDSLGEGNHIWNRPAAQFVPRARESYPIGFFEEPLPYTDIRACAVPRTSTTIPVAGGETLTSLEQGRDCLEHRPSALAQIDAAFMGGPTNFIKIARLCELQGIPIATHAWSATPRHRCESSCRLCQPQHRDLRDAALQSRPARSQHAPRRAAAHRSVGRAADFGKRARPSHRHAGPRRKAARRFPRRASLRAGERGVRLRHGQSAATLMQRAFPGNAWPRSRSRGALAPCRKLGRGRPYSLPLPPRDFLNYHPHAPLIP
jgi:L-alanine-DL-glutamate epimerase-like enolase superfamily enzyme